MALIEPLCKEKLTDQSWQKHSELLDLFKVCVKVQHFHHFNFHEYTPTELLYTSKVARDLLDATIETVDEKYREEVRQQIYNEYDYQPTGRMTPEQTVDALLEASRLPISLSNIHINPDMSLEEKGQGLKNSDRSWS